MQYENLQKELYRMRFEMHMENHPLEPWLDRMIGELEDYKQEVDDYEMYLRDEARDSDSLLEDCEEQVRRYEDMIDWLKGLSVYQLSEWKQGKLDYD